MLLSAAAAPVPLPCPCVASPSGVAIVRSKLAVVCPAVTPCTQDTICAGSGRSTLIRDALWRGRKFSAEIQRVIKERMTIQEDDKATPSALVNVRPVVAAMKDFFGNVGEGDRAGVWSEVPTEHAEFRKDNRRMLDKAAKKRKAEEMGS